MPKLLLTFDGSPETLMIGPEMTAWCEANIANLEVASLGPAAHLAPEDQPAAISAALVTWANQHHLRTTPAQVAAALPAD